MTDKRTSPDENERLLPYLPHMRGAEEFAISARPDQAPNLCEQGLPVPPRMLFLGYGSTRAEYLTSGQRDVTTMLEILEEDDFVLQPDSSVLDMGCGAGRMLRHVHPNVRQGECWGIDISTDCINWCQRNLHPPLNFSTGTFIPYVPFEDRTFDLIYCGSLFTHIDDLVDSWLLELRRILKPNGRLFVTIHDRHTVGLLETKWRDHWLAKRIASSPLFQREKENAGVVVLGRGHRSQVFYDVEYFEKLASPAFRVSRIVPESYGYQTALVLCRST